DLQQILRIDPAQAEVAAFDRDDQLDAWRVEDAVDLRAPERAQPADTGIGRSAELRDPECRFGLPAQRTLLGAIAGCGGQRILDRQVPIDPASCPRRPF